MNGVISLQDSPEFYKLIVESFKDYAIFTMDKEGIITTWSSGAESVLLYNSEEIIGRNGDILYLPEDIANHIPAVELDIAMRDGKAINERFHIKKGGIKFWASGLVFPLYNDQGEHIGFSKIMRNVSEKDQAENNLREEKTIAQTIVSTYDECIVILNSDLQVVNATASFTNFFSLESGNIIGKDFYQILDKGINLAQLRSALDTTIKHQTFYSNFEIDFVHPDTGARKLIVKPRRIYQPPNLLFSLEFEDVSATYNMMKEKDVFISVASHEIRTPISVIKAYGQILDRELKDTKPIVRKALDKINEQIVYLTSLLAALLDTSRLTTGKIVMEREVFNLCELTREQAESFKLTQSSHYITLAHEADSMVYADRVRTGSVINNLLSNAVKYSPNASEVVVRIDADENSVKVSVQDFGLGIPEKEQDKIFQRFGRTESVKKTKIPGFGLGLHQAAEIIKIQGGHIGFTSRENEGTIFYFTLPLYS